MLAQKCKDIATAYLSSGRFYQGFDPDNSPDFTDYALQEAYRPYRTYLDYCIAVGEKYGSSQEDVLSNVSKEYETSLKIWNRLVSEHDWQPQDFQLFDDIYLDHCKGGTYLSYCVSNDWDEYQLIAYANQCWNTDNKDKPQKATEFPEEKAAAKLARFDVATEEYNRKMLDDLHHYTKGADISGFNKEELHEHFGSAAVSIIYIQDRMLKNEETNQILRSDLQKQYAPKAQL
ncbi:MAG: hypothetical protein DI626_01920 [Micavibrio aeruginosavorus]|uniref:Uncharacterized protein n=1 Tax=Micavibrio aeruginosavorus TaxID=349221 RepID=A0A2W5C2R7_9BACT|nr:MAG: hypothetical protein DI626_01920 [Micavibrio aeruginosavorus]